MSEKVWTPAEYAAHLATSGQRLNPMLVKTMNRAGFEIRDDWRSRAAAKNPTHAPKYPSTIQMRRTIVTSAGEVVVTVEPLGVGQGNLGMILEHTGNEWSRAQHSDREAAEAEIPVLLSWLQKLIVDVVT